MKGSLVFKKVLSLFLCFIMFFCTFSNLFTPLRVYADSSDRRKALISFAQNKNLDELTEDDLLSLTADDLRVIGIYLSNFYTPWGTVVGASNSDVVDYNTDEFKKDLIKALVNTNMNEDVATYLVEAVFNATNTTAVPITATVSGETMNELSWYNFLSLFNKYNESQWSLNVGDTEILNSSDNQQLNVWYKTLCGIMAFCDLSNGIGSSLIELNEKGFKNMWGQYKDDMDTILKFSIVGQTLYMDCFGNIIANCGAVSYIVVPACMNPVVTKSASSDSMSYNAVNMQSIYLMTHDVLNSSDSVSCTFDITKDKKIQELFDTSKVQNCRLYRDYSHTKIPEGSNTYSLYKALEGKIGTESKESNWKLDKEDMPFVDDNAYVRFPSIDLNSRTNKESVSDTSGIGAVIASSCNVISDLVAVDTLGLAKFNTLDGKDVSTLNRVSVFTASDVISNAMGLSTIALNNDKLMSLATSSAGKVYLVSIFTSYVCAYSNYLDNSFSNIVSYSWDFTKLPKLDCGDVFTNIEVKTSSEALQQETMSMVYYILHPTKGVSYIKLWAKNKISAVVTGVHEQIVGNSNTSNSTGISKYVGYSGYVTLPELKDLSWTNWLLVQYDNYMVFLIIIVIIVMAMYVIVGSLTKQAGLAGILMFIVCACLPPIAISSAVSVTNKVSNSIYSDKFLYWALMQHECYITDLQNAVSENNSDLYLSKLMEQQAKDSGNDVSTTGVVTLKWMCPKKDNYLMNIEDELSEQSGSTNFLTSMVTNGLNSTISGENYLSTANNMYLYRSYTDISSYSYYVYNNIMNDGNKYKLDSLKLDSEKFRGIRGAYSNLVSSDIGSLSDSTSLGFNYNTLGSDNIFDSSLNRNKRFYALMTSNNIESASNKSLDDLDLSRFTMGVPTSSYDVTLSDFNKTGSNISPSTVSNECFALMSESPFYYFSWNLYDQQRSVSLSNITDLYLSSNYFYNLNDKVKDTKAYNEMRDYMDMKSMFTVVIPYLKQANDNVKNWDKTYGLDIKDGVSSDEDDITDIKNACYTKYGVTNYTDCELWYNYWHNVNVERLFNTYTPWVDTMYDCSYAKATTVHVAGKKYVINDPLDPSSYPGADKGRPMIFSRSEMEYYGLKEDDLTEVEQKILKVENSSYNDLLKVMNYCTFNEEVLNTASSMIMTFNFNKMFSQNSFSGSDYTLYPQSYELKNFSYDAFLRLILAESTGENLQSGSGSLYDRIVSKSGVITGLAIVVLDLLAVYAIPALKLFFLIAIFLLSIVMILSASLKLRMNIVSVLSKSLLKPICKFCAISIALAFSVSLFMSNGNTAVTGETGVTISLGDPTMVVFVMIIINGIALLLYYRVVKSVIKDCIREVKIVSSSVAGTASGVASKLAGAVAGGVVLKSLGDGTGSVANGVGGLVNGVGGAISKTAKGTSEVARGIGDAKHRSLENKNLKAKTMLTESATKLTDEKAKLTNEKAKTESSNRALNELTTKNKEKRISDNEQRRIDNINNKTRTGRKKVKRENRAVKKKANKK